VTKLPNLGTTQDILLIHCGNNLGEIFIYAIDYTQEQIIDEESGIVTKDNVKLLNMIVSR